MLKSGNWLGHWATSHILALGYFPNMFWSVIYLHCDTVSYYFCSCLVECEQSISLYPSEFILIHPSAVKSLINTSDPGHGSTTCPGLNTNRIEKKDLTIVSSTEMAKEDASMRLSRFVTIGKKKGISQRLSEINIDRGLQHRKTMLANGALVWE